MKAASQKQTKPKSTEFSLVTSDGTTFELWEYPFPETRGKRFKLFLCGKLAEAARTEGKGQSKLPPVRHYTYIKHGGKSMYVAAWLDAGSRVEVRAR